MRGAQYKPCGVKSFIIDQLSRSHISCKSKYVFLTHDDPEIITFLENLSLPIIRVSSQYNRFSLFGYLLELYLVLLSPVSWLSLHNFLPIPVFLSKVKSAFVLHDLFAYLDPNWFGHKFTSSIRRQFYRYIVSSSIKHASILYADNVDIFASIPNSLSSNQRIR